MKKSTITGITVVAALVSAVALVTVSIGFANTVTQINAWKDIADRAIYSAKRQSCLTDYWKALAEWKQEGIEDAYDSCVAGLGPIPPTAAGSIEPPSSPDSPTASGLGLSQRAASAIVDHARGKVADLISDAQAYVEENVHCNNGEAFVAVKTRAQGFERMTFDHIPVPAEVGDKATLITCAADGQYQLKDETLSNMALSLYAMAAADESRKGQKTSSAKGAGIPTTDYSALVELERQVQSTKQSH